VKRVIVTGIGIQCYLHVLFYIYSVCTLITKMNQASLL